MKHKINPRIYNAVEPIKVAIVGVGGTGSFLLRELARINHSIKALGHAGLYVEAYDPKDVTEVSTIRQCFSPSDIEDNKACAMVTKVNRAYGTNWEAYPEEYDFDKMSHAIMITCVDSVAPRRALKKGLELNKQQHESSQVLYWLDTGNGKDSGQVVLGGSGLPDIIDMFPDLEDHEDLNEPSCSAIETLTHQDFYINLSVAVDAGKILWKLFSDVELDKNGSFINLDSGKTVPLSIAS